MPNKSASREFNDWPVPHTFQEGVQRQTIGTLRKTVNHTWDDITPLM